jgi:hypothetical protein
VVIISTVCPDDNLVLSGTSKSLIFAAVHLFPTSV